MGIKIFFSPYKEIEKVSYCLTVARKPLKILDFCGKTPVLLRITCLTVKEVVVDMGLRDYQIDLYNKTKSEFAKGRRRVLVVAPCG